MGVKMILTELRKKYNHKKPTELHFSHGTLLGWLETDYLLPCLQRRERGGQPPSAQELESCISGQTPGSPKLSILSFKGAFHGRGMGQSAHCVIWNMYSRHAVWHSCAAQSSWLWEQHREYSAPALLSVLYDNVHWSTLSVLLLLSQVNISFLI